MDITGIDFDDPYEYLAGPIGLKIKFTIPGFALVTENEIIFTPVVVSGIFMRGMSHLYWNVDKKERKYPFRDRCSRLVILTENIKLPGTFSPGYLPEVKSFDEIPAGFEGVYKLSKSGSSLMMNVNVSLNKRIYDVEDWKAFRKTVSAHQKFSREPVILNFN